MGFLYLATFNNMDAGTKVRRKLDLAMLVVLQDKNNETKEGQENQGTSYNFNPCGI